MPRPVGGRGYPRNQPEFNEFFAASEVLGRHRAAEPLEATGDPLDDEAAVLIGRLRAGWGEDGALEAVTELAKTIDGLTRRVEEALAADAVPVAA